MVQDKEAAIGRLVLVTYQSLWTWDQDFKGGCPWSQELQLAPQRGYSLRPSRSDHLRKTRKGKPVVTNGAARHLRPAQQTLKTPPV